MEISTGRRWLSHFRVVGSLFTATLGLTLGCGGAAAQEAASSSQPAEPVCVVRSENDGRGALKTVLASCGGQGVWLGSAEHFQAFSNPRLGAVLVDLKREFSRRVMLVSLVEGQAPLVEDLTGQLARAAGRGPLSDIEGVTLDLGGFVSEGTIGVRAQVVRHEVNEAREVSARVEDVSAQVQLDAQIEMGRSLRRGTPAGAKL